jgi:hypothetical protein
MKYVYKDGGFDIGHWIFQFIGNFVHLFTILLKLLTLNLVWFDFEFKWLFYSLNNSDKLTNFIKNICK